MVEKEKKIKWDAFWARYSKDYPMARDLRIRIGKEIEKAWKEISPFVGEEFEFSLKVTREGELMATPITWLLIGIMAEVVLRKTSDEVVEVIKEIFKK